MPAPWKKVQQQPSLSLEIANAGPHERRLSKRYYVKVQRQQDRHADYDYREKKAAHSIIVPDECP